ncbi:hypothetical protein PSCICJ_51170 [Pseudomonas cichorii]|uniref:PIN domain-containing protein n=1 Tax=Pseudomonas cichorii TaxID=36746 RepID=UPI001911060A|nr:PIN domain-containing protein [Pseudomonas cichorii]GFM68999.1 hypothetical protein PSCICJ_51170 [Pseudomonas cichorii]
MQLQSRVVFLDTNVYIAKNYQFLTHSLGAIKKLRDAEEILLIVPDVTDMEVRSHIRSESSETAAVLKKVKKDAMLIRNLPNIPAYGIFTDIHANDIEQQLINNWEEFLGGTGIERLTVDCVVPSRVFKRYFSVAPPFASGAKEKEFADAFVLERLADFALERSHLIHVISTDKDLAKYCAEDPRLVFGESVDAFIDAVNISVSVEPSAFAAEALNKVSADIMQSVESLLPDVDYEILSSDWNAELEEVSITNISFVRANLVFVEDKQCLYEIEYSATIKTIEFVKDYDRSPFDHEDDSYPFVLETQVERTFEQMVSIETTIFFQDKLLETVSFDVDMPYGLKLSNPVEEIRRELDINGE